MKFEILIITITAFFMYNAYHDGKILKNILSYKKYFQIALWGVLGLGIYLLIKRNPEKSRSLLVSANNMVKYMPLDRSSIDMIHPIFNFTKENFIDIDSDNEDEGRRGGGYGRGESVGEIGGGGRVKQTKRSVSETKKKYVASQQNWKCGDCGLTLNHTFEIDHIKRLEYGGSNDVSNLVALCRNCHGNKTAMENM